MFGDHFRSVLGHVGRTSDGKKHTELGGEKFLVRSRAGLRTGLCGTRLQTVVRRVVRKGCAQLCACGETLCAQRVVRTGTDRLLRCTRLKPCALRVAQPSSVLCTTFFCSGTRLKCVQTFFWVDFFPRNTVEKSKQSAANMIHNTPYSMNIIYSAKFLGNHKRPF